MRLAGPGYGACGRDMVATCRNSDNYYNLLQYDQRILYPLFIDFPSGIA
jgi:hypothetical protein